MSKLMIAAIAAGVVGVVGLSLGAWKLVKAYRMGKAIVANTSDADIEMAARYIENLQGEEAAKAYRKRIQELKDKFNAKK